MGQTGLVIIFAPLRCCVTTNLSLYVKAKFYDAATHISKVSLKGGIQSRGKKGGQISPFSPSVNDGVWAAKGHLFFAFLTIWKTNSSLRNIHTVKLC